MDTNLDEAVAVTLPKGTLLMLFEYLNRSCDAWRAASGAGRGKKTFVLQQPDAAETTALWHLEGAVERTLPEIFSARYSHLLTEWKQHLTSHSGL